MTDVSIILTAHREGVLAGASARSAFAAIDEAQRKDLACEVIAVLDRASEATKAVLSEALRNRPDIPSRLIEADEGDPGQARNRGIEAATGEHACFLDGDDLWSFNWIVGAWELCRERPDAVAQSMVNVVFGNERLLWWHIDSESSLFDPGYLTWANYWDALSFARTEIYRSHPFRRNDLSRGFGHEDWHWSCLTYAKGIPHKPVPDTVHFKRRRHGSQMSLVERAGGVVWPLQALGLETGFADGVDRGLLRSSA